MIEFTLIVLVCSFARNSFLTLFVSLKFMPHSLAVPIAFLCVAECAFLECRSGERTRRPLLEKHGQGRVSQEQRLLLLFIHDSIAFLFSPPNGVIAKTGVGNCTTGAVSSC